MSITREFLRRPRLTGAVAASSRYLAEAMTTGLDLHRARLVVELGAGTGVFTDGILRRLAPHARLVVIELNPVLARGLASRYRTGRGAGDGRVEVVCAPAEQLSSIVDTPVDAVVSGLPWTVMPPARRLRTLDAVCASLDGAGRFSTFAYLHAAWTPPGRHLAAELAARFSTVERSRVVWANLPPAFVHRGHRPV